MDKIQIEISSLRILTLIAGVLSFVLPWMVYYVPLGSGADTAYAVVYFDFLGRNEGFSVLGIAFSFITYELAIFGGLYLCGYIVFMLNVSVNKELRYEKIGWAGWAMIMGGMLGYILWFFLIVMERAEFEPGEESIYPFIGLFGAIATVSLAFYELKYPHKFGYFHLFALSKTELHFCRFCGKPIRAEGVSVCSTCRKKEKYQGFIKEKSGPPGSEELDLA